METEEGDAALSSSISPGWEANSLSVGSSYPSALNSHWSLGLSSPDPMVPSPKPSPLGQQRSSP
jgi:hypothetical protein